MLLPKRFWIGAVRGLISCLIAIAISLQGSCKSAPEGISGGPYLGVALEEEASLKEFNQATGVDHGMVARSFPFPAIVSEESHSSRLENFLQEAADEGAVPVLSLETVTTSDPPELSGYTDDQVRELGAKLSEFGIPVIVRFNPEMNAPLHSWGQQERKYVDSFRRFTRVFKESFPLGEMAWTPQHGEGYPWKDDRRLEATTTPYNSYYPGDYWVDWVGISLFHPSLNQQRTDDGPAVLPDGETVLTAVDEFSRLFPEKKLMLAETAASRGPEQPVSEADSSFASEVAIKKAWITKVYSPEMAKKVDAVIWREATEGEVDWRFSDDSSLVRLYRTLVAKSWLN